MKIVISQLAMISGFLFLGVHVCSSEHLTDQKTQESPPAEEEQLLPENFTRFAGTMFTGGEPSRKHLEQLFALGVRTVISVDGAETPHQDAAEIGLRYIHLPIGYDGVPEEVSAALESLVNKGNEKIFIHCHHGKHRGPAVAAIFALLADTLTMVQALDKMEQIGTGEEYTGLWDSVRNFNKKKLDQVQPRTLVAYHKVDDFTASMARIDRHYDAVKYHLAKNNAPDSAHIGSEELQHQSLLLEEALKESMRLQDSPDADHKDKAFHDYLRISHEGAFRLRQSITSGKEAEVTSAFKRLKHSCVDCHADFRD
jgi:protein-tyrosine phosphatase